jgi:hypothetical protein
MLDVIKLKYFVIVSLVIGAFLEPSAKARGGSELPPTKVEAVGFSSERLSRLDALMGRMVDDKEFAGIVTMAARHGKVFHSKAYRLRDIASVVSRKWVHSISGHCYDLVHAERGLGDQVGSG